MQEQKIQKMDGKSMDIAAADKEKLRAVFPQCFTEGKLDIDKLLSLCGEYIDNDYEKYKFEWKGKSECLRIAGKRSTGTLRPCPEESVDFENTNNLYIEGDNLEVLKLLQTAYYRKVKMIYIDPPYNTGNDFVYEDDFKDPLAKYKEITSQTTKSNPETMGRYHTNWLNMMYPRLRLAANLLRDDGVIFISIDDNEVTNLRKLCDEVFGEENFVIQISWRRTDNQPNVGKIARVKEYIIVYCKNFSYLTLGKLPLSEKAKAEYRYNDYAKGLFRRSILLDKTRGRYSYPKETKTGKILNGPWMVPENKFDEMDKNGEIYWTSGGDEQPYGKIFLSESQGQIANDFWGIEFGTNQRASLEVEKLFEKRLFDFPKPVSLLQNLLNLGTTSDTGIILDFFSGSATTAHAVMQLNAEDGGTRQFIMVQLPELCDEKSEAFKAGYKNICEIGKERIRRAGAKIKEQNTNVDVGFKVLKLDTSNLVKWDDTPTDDTEALKERFDTMIKSLKFDRTELDVVYEVMLKLGVPVTEKVFEKQINGRKVYSIGDDSLILVCLDKSNGGITPEDISAMCELAPAKIVAAEEAFKDDIALSNAYYISKDSGIEIELL